MQAWEAVISAVFPLRCGLCGKCADSGLCEDCVLELVPLPEPVRLYPGQSPLHSVASLYQYEGRAAQAVQRLKYQRVTSLGDPMASLMAKGHAALGLPPFDVVVPVPIHWRRRFWRGFNQAELLAKELMAPSGGKGLLRTRHTPPQVRLSAEQRLHNLDGAFRAGPDVMGKVVLLVDDVHTTGSTGQACALALRQAGAAHVSLLTFARNDDLRSI